ncbi:hypothetical protein HN415_00975, partial [Candidatus Woesearchaeota archaeon]|nr:hypothetical protein [Candidatus Woesearchaeota archaeon]
MNLSKILIELLWKRKLGIEEYAHEKEFIRIYNKIKNKSKIHITIGENFNLYWLLKIRTKSIKGSV